MVHVLEPGARIQNWYSGLGQPEATPVMVTAVPAEVGEGGAAEAVTDVHTLIVSANSRTTLSAPTKICPPASVGVAKWVTPKAAL